MTPRDLRRTATVARHHDMPLVAAALDAAAERIEGLERLERALPCGLWGEDVGPVLWWCFPVNEPPYCGTPLDDDWPGYHTHWTRIIVPAEPVAIREALREVSTDQERN